MSTAIATVDRDKVVSDLRALVDEYGPAALEKIDHMGRAFRLADGVQKFRALVASAMPLIKPLQGSALGFLTDRDKQGGYGPDVVAECATEALMRGLTLHGNQWNIIGGRCYITKEGMRVIVGNLPGLTDLNLSPSIPQFTGIGAVLDFRATWKLDGKPQELTRKVVVKAQAGQVDLAIGKATRKMLAAVYEKVTGSSISDGEIEEPTGQLPPRKVDAAESQAKIIEEFEGSIAAAATVDDLRSVWFAASSDKKSGAITEEQLAALVVLMDKRKAELVVRPPEAEQRPDPTTAAQSAAATPPATATKKARASKPTSDARSDLYVKLQKVATAYGCDMDAILFEVREQWGTDILADLTDADVDDAAKWADGKLAAKTGV